MMVFAHDYLAQNLNQKNQKLITKIKTGNHDFKIDGMQLNQVVKSFRKYWQSTAEGLVPMSAQPEVSIELKGFIIMPELHQFMKVDLDYSDSDIQGFVKIEFSNQQEQHYYDSAELNLSQLSSSLNLNDLSWTQNNISNNTRSIVKWSDIGPLDAWVMRFYLTNKPAFILHGLTIEQNGSQLPVATNQRLCSHLELSSMDCLVNNKMRHLNQSDSYQFGSSAIKYPTLLASSPWLVLVLSWVLTLVLIYLVLQPNIVIATMVSVVYLTVYILHQSWIFDVVAIFRWSLLLMFFILIWQYRQAFYAIRSRALWLWIGSVLLAVCLVALNGFNIDFIQSFPLYFLWAAVQQVLIGPVFSTRIHHELKASKLTTACLVGVLFSIIHSPNHMLMIVTLIGGFVWSYAWLKYENLYANAFSHALLALVFYQSMPTQWLGSARIGVFF
jgi:hypothetical protein